MTGLVRRLPKILVLVGLALGLTASSGTAASPTQAPMLGVVPHANVLHGLEPRTSTAATATAGGTNLSLRTKPCKATCWVMRQNTTYAIYWVPSGQSVADGYETDINQFLTDVAAASGSTTNVYSVATQYYDSTGFISYQSTFGGSDVDTDPFPANGCNDQVDSVCLTKQQIQTEIGNVIAAKGWSAGPDSLFILMTPNGVGSCYDSFGRFLTQRQRRRRGDQHHQPRTERGDHRSERKRLVRQGRRRDCRPLRVGVREAPGWKRPKRLQPGDQRPRLLAAGGIQQRRQHLPAALHRHPNEDDSTG